MRRLLPFLACALFAGGCGNLKYQSLKDTSVPNPPTAPIKVFVQQFPVSSKAGVVPPSDVVCSWVCSGCVDAHRSTST